MNRQSAQSGTAPVASAKPASALTQLAALSVLLLSTLVLYTSQGLTHTLVPLRLGSGGTAGVVTAAYFLGFMLGAFHGGALIRRVGHIRTYGALAAATIGLLLLMSLFDAVWLWLLSRVLHGAAIASLAVVVESWLTGVATTHTRGRILAVYTIVVYGGIGAGPLFLLVYPFTTWEPFAVAALLLVAASVPVLLWRVEAPAPRMGQRAGLRKVFKVSPSSTATAAAAGVGSGALTAQSPLYALSLGLDSGGVGLLMSLPVILGLALQWPLGRLSDRLDRRRVMVSVTAAGGVLSLVLAAGTALPLISVFLLFALQQGAGYALYAMALSHANDWMDKETDTTDIAAALLMIYGIGATVGPLFAGAAAQGMGPAAGFAVTSAALALSAVYGLYRIIHLPTPPIADQLEYTLVTDTTPEVFELEPGTVPDSRFDQQADTASESDKG